MAIIQHTWTAPTSGPPDSYNIYEGAQSGNETLLVNVLGTQTTYSHPRADGPYAAYVTAVTAGVESGPSNETVGVITTPPLSIPTLTATPSLPGNVPSIILAGF